MKISEIIIDKYKLRIPPTVYYELLADVQEVEEEQEPTDKNFTKADIDAIVKAINEGWELRVNEILSKIRAEISTVYESLDGYDPDSLGAFLGEIDEILDKYKAETEG
jgi:hypothetical protein